MSDFLDKIDIERVLCQQDTSYFNKIGKVQKSLDLSNSLNKYGVLIQQYKEFISS